MRKTFVKITAVLVVLFISMFVMGNKTFAREVEVKTSDYGYGKYLITVRGVGYDGVYDEDSVAFYYLPVEGTVTVDSLTGKYNLNLNYTAYKEGEEYGGHVAKMIVNVYNAAGELIPALSNVTVYPPTTEMEIKLAANELPNGTYTVKIAAYSIDGDELYEPYVIHFEYKSAEVPDAGTPDTGGLFKNTNISKEDYLITGLIVFFVLGIVAFGVVAKNKKPANKKRH